MDPASEHPEFVLELQDSLLSFWSDIVERAISIFGLLVSIMDSLILTNILLFFVFLGVFSLTGYQGGDH